jgi:signal transduction histidine kinase
VLLIGGPDIITLTVRDEGAGVHLERALVGNGLGLTSMKERLKLVNGQVSIDSKPGQGTEIQARVPLLSKKKAAHSG